MSSGIRLITDKCETKEEKILPFKVVDGTDRYMQLLPDAFERTAQALANRDQSELPSGGIGMRIQDIDPDDLRHFLELASERISLPVTDVTSGVPIIEPKAQIWLRNIFYAFNGTRLWNDVIEPCFDHIHFYSALNESEFRHRFLYYLEVPSSRYFGIDTNNTRYARWINVLMSRIQLNQPPLSYYLHEEIGDYIEDNHGLRNRDNPEEWRRLYEKYWKLNDHQLLTDAMRDFMIGRTLVYFDIDAPGLYEAKQLERTFSTDEICNAVQLHASERGLQKPFEDYVLNLIFGRMVSRYSSYIVVGGRPHSKETAMTAIEAEISEVSNRYTFFAVVGDEMLKKG